MPPLAAALVRTGLALKLNQVKRATSSYMHDRAEQTQGAAVSYAVAGGLYAAAGIFLIATLLVGATALFRWVELRYGLFQAFGATGGLLLVLAILCGVLAASRLKRPARQFPSLGSRLRVAISASPASNEAATSSVPASAARASASEFKPSTRPASPAQGAPAASGPVKAGLVLAATLAGWVLARRRNLNQKPKTRIVRKPSEKAPA
ncbi:MAG: phage holin family protein [Tardiphaga sp.]